MPDLPYIPATPFPDVLVFECDEPVVPIGQADDIPYIEQFLDNGAVSYGDLCPAEEPPYTSPRPNLFPPPPPVDPSGTPDLLDIIVPDAYGVPTGTVTTSFLNQPPPVNIIVPYYRGSTFMTKFVEMKEYAGSGKVTYTRAGWKGERIFEVPWSQWMDFANALVGYSVLSSEGFPVYTLPDVFSEGMPWMFCRELAVEGIEGLIRGQDDDILTPRITYERAKLTATYYPLDMDVEFRGSGEIIQLPGSAYAWLGIDIRKGLADVYPLGNFNQSTPPDTTSIDIVSPTQNIGKLLPGGEFSLVKHYVPAPYFSQLLSIENCVNDNAFLGFQPTTLLCTNLDSRRTWTLLGVPVWDITFKFIWKPNGWLSLYNPNPNWDFNPQGGGAQHGVPMPGYQYIRSLSTPNVLDVNTFSPPLIWRDGSLIGQITNNVSALSRDYGFIYPLANFDPILYFI